MQYPVSSARLQEFRQSMLVFPGKLRPEVVSLIFNEIRAEVDAAAGVDISELGNFRKRMNQINLSLLEP
jgi:hypothetical protein